MEANGNGLELTFYGDPEPTRPMLELFQSLETGSIEWTGNIPEASPPPPEPVSGTVTLNLDSLEFGKESENTWSGEVNNLNFMLEAEDLAYAEVIADLVDVTFTFGESSGLPTLTIEAELTGNVEISLFFSILPLPGLQQALYHFEGEEFYISITIIKPLDVNIVYPLDGESVEGFVEVQANVVTAPGISVDQVNWWADGKEDQNWDCHFGGGMWYDDGDGLWKADWPTYDCAGGWFGLGVAAEGVQESAGMRYQNQEMIGVRVVNPWVESWLIHPGDGWEDVHGVEIQINGEIRYTTFSLKSEWIGQSLAAPGLLWEDPNFQFSRWEWNTGSSLDNPLELTPEIYNNARPLKCIYEETTPP